MSRLRLAGLLLTVVGVVLLGVGLTRSLDGGSSTGGSSGDQPATGKPDSTITQAMTAAVPASAPFPSLTQTQVRVGGRTLQVVVADSEPERELGLRQRRDLGSYDGMLFAFPVDSSDAFTMSTVPVALDIAFYDAVGRLVSRQLMQPCAGSESECPVYRADHSYRYALETLAGHLPSGSLS